MKIVHVIDQLGLGGAERVCVNLINLFYQNGYDVKLILFDREGELLDLIDKGVPISVLEKKKGKLKAYRKIVQEVRDADIIHVHMRQNFRFIQKAFLLFGGKKKIILHDHYGRIAINKKVPMFYKTLFKPDLFIGCSQLLSDWAIEKVKIKPEKVFMINNFVVKYPIDEADKTGKGLVLIGNLKPVKNHEFAIRLAKKLNETLTIYCSTIGGKYYEQLQKLIKDLDYAHKIKFATGCNNIQVELKKYKIALLTSLSEGDPLVIMEYLAQGIPCICSNVGESVKIIKKYYPHLVQNEFHLDSWEKAYGKAILLSSEDIEKIYDQHFTSQLYLNKYLNAYNGLLL